MSDTKRPLFSIITVVYNGEQFIGTTIQSVKSQTCENYEYIIIDGSSSDKTLDIIKDNKHNVSFILSEKDNGIYDAMNKGASIARGQFLLFLNAGDTFSSNSVLSEIEKMVFDSEKIPDVIIGSTTIFSAHGKRIKLLKPLNFSKLFLNMLNTRVVCHQSILVNRSSFLPYSTLYRIKGDLNWYYDLLNNGRCSNIMYVDSSISNYTLGGLSNCNLKLSYKEQLAVTFRQNNCFIFILTLPFLALPLLFKLKQKVKQALVLE